MPATKTNAIKDKVMPILLAQHNVAALGKERQTEKVAKLEGFVDRAIERGLTLKHVDENLALARPPHWFSED